MTPFSAGGTCPPSSAATPTAPAPSTTSLQRSISITIASAVSSSPTTTTPSVHCAQQRERELARALDRDAVGDRQRRGGRHRHALAQRLGVGRAGGDLHADHLHLGPRGLDRDRHPGAQAAAADRHDDAGEVGHVLEQLEAERALPGDDVRVVERVHEREPALARPVLGGVHALVDRAAADVDRRALPARRLDLGDRRVVGDEHLARHAAQLRGRGAAPGRGCRRRRATTPLRQPSSPSAASLAATPRTLNEPVRCRFSAFSTTSPPARSEIVREDSIGVRRATVCTASRAALMSSSVGERNDRVDLDLGPERQRRPRRSWCAPAGRSGSRPRRPR